MNDLVKTNVPGLYKDTRTGVIINTNEYQKTKKIAPLIEREVTYLKTEIVVTKTELNNIKTEITEIKELLLRIVENTGK
jgi:hypothetical protein